MTETSPRDRGFAADMKPIDLVFEVLPAGFQSKVILWELEDPMPQPAQPARLQIVMRPGGRNAQCRQLSGLDGPTPRGLETPKIGRIGFTSVFPPPAAPWFRFLLFSRATRTGNLMEQSTDPQKPQQKMVEAAGIEPAS